VFLETLKDIYYAEKQIFDALPKMAKAAQSDRLRAAFEKHHDETEVQIERTVGASLPTAREASYCGFRVAAFLSGRLDPFRPRMLLWEGVCSTPTQVCKVCSCFFLD
jgi:hypothetical protein